jgi:hypothetical protein
MAGTLRGVRVAILIPLEVEAKIITSLTEQSVYISLSERWQLMKCSDKHHILGVNCNFHIKLHKISKDVKFIS